MGLGEITIYHSLNKYLTSASVSTVCQGGERGRETSSHNALHFSSSLTRASNGGGQGERNRENPQSWFKKKVKGGFLKIVENVGNPESES